MSLRTSVSVITGAGRGIGLAAAKLFVENGHRVVLSDLNLEEARVAFKGQSDWVEFVEADVTNEPAMKAVFTAALSRFGRVDSAVMNAGILSPVKPWLDSSAADVNRMCEINITGSWITAKHAVNAMLASPEKGRGGSLVFVSSVASLYGQPGMSGYCASKWGVRGLSLTAAQEFAEFGIRANCIQPGATATEMFASFPPELQEAVCNSNAMKRPGLPSEVAEAMLFFASDKSSFVTGSTLAVHGGQTPT